MRPITVNINQMSYNKIAQLSQNMLVPQAYWSVTEAPTKKRKGDVGVATIRVTVSDALTELNTLLARDQIGTAYEGLLAAVTPGYKAATADLLSQTGTYCAFCDTPLWSGLVAQPFKPLASYPLEAFNIENLFLICPACGHARRAQPDRQNKTTYALPTNYWQGAPDDTPLPFRYNMYCAAGFAADQVIDPDFVKTTLLLAYQMGYVHVSSAEAFTLGEPSLSKVYIDVFELLPLHLGDKQLKYPKLNDLYQLRDLAIKLQLNGIVRMFDAIKDKDLAALNNGLRQFDLNSISTDAYTLDGLVHHFRLNNPSSELRTALTKVAPVLAAVESQRYVHIYVKVTEKNLGRTVDTNIGHTIGLMQLNNMGAVRFTEDNLDRRVELRTMAYFEALSQSQQWLRVKQTNETLTKTIKAPETLLTAPFLDQLRVTIGATGFWGVWLSVFGNPIRQWLNGVLPGTASTKWQI
ncbi:MAG: hypothetical protein KDE31_19490 [Caldilineaceae bacterium]|nr:hypothetical protein [Caldilineaceae bacterium]MCB9109384.1 hypothetical protein [Anaerolineales bacterium]